MYAERGRAQALGRRLPWLNAHRIALPTANGTINLRKAETYGRSAEFPIAMAGEPEKLTRIVRYV
jgi:hypothetical protein